MKSFNRSILFVTIAIAGGVATGIAGFGEKATSLFGNSQLETKQEIQIPQSYIIQGTNSKSLAQVVKNVGGDVSREFPIINAISAVLTPSQAETIKQLGNVRVQDDRRVMTMSVLTSIGESLLSTAKQAVIDNHIADQIDADRLHDIGITGSGITVAVIDSGANIGGSIGSYLYNDTAGFKRGVKKYDAFLGTETKLLNDDDNGHGTHVTSVIANSLAANNGNYNGIAPDVNLVSIKAFDQNGESSYSTVLDALNWVFEKRTKFNIRVVNLSLGAEVNSRYWQDPINQAVMRLWHAGIVVVSSAGNNGEEMGISVPGNTPYIITVGATTDNYTPFEPSDDRVTSFSSKGPTYEGFVKPEIVAPGARVAVKMESSLILRSLRLSMTGSDYAEISGTSQASAIVAGVAALIIQNDPYITPDNVKCKIVATAQAAKVNGNLAFSPFQQGAGMVNAYDAVMSQATNCANKGLDIDQDLMGLKHYFGPVVEHPSGKLQILLPSGGVLTEGAHWSEGTLDLEGAHWSEGMMGLEGAHWSEGMMGLEGAHWSEGIMGLEGAHWSEGMMGLEGAHWTEGTMGLEGAHWSEGKMGLEGAHWTEGKMGIWTEGKMNLESADLDIAPIDPSIEVVFDTTEWQ